MSLCIQSYFKGCNSFQNIYLLAFWRMITRKKSDSMAFLRVFQAQISHFRCIWAGTCRLILEMRCAQPNPSKWTGYIRITCSRVTLQNTRLCPYYNLHQCLYLTWSRQNFASIAYTDLDTNDKTNTYRGILPAEAFSRISIQKSTATKYGMAACGHYWY